ncbi:gag protease polyprotein [Cucumis melo var. makuwa]|uniref:Gag protease polyprotein n=1 Tax=Cucumis melo var. makuwa TaxID=1194695 RepID=A0A5D3E5U7_CUCMM|nr:gag protease polyprotein [Cucumis melo var. makuwa]TYK31026.1 gag protease polyprotein [Cucumis melo var. makuwa]
MSSSSRGYRPPISDLLSGQGASHRRAPLRRTSAALKQSRSSKASKPRIIPAVERQRSVCGSLLSGYCLWSYVVEGLLQYECCRSVTVVDDLVWTEGLIRVSFGITRLIRASFGITRLICASFRITRLIRASFGITRLIGVRVQRGADRRGARRMREGHMDASGFLYSSADTDLGCESVFCVLMAKTIVASRQEWPRRPRRGAGRVQPKVQPVAQATDPTAPVTHADLATMEQRFRDLIKQMREQQQPGPPTPAPAPAPALVPVVPQVVPDQLSAEAKHLRDFRKYPHDIRWVFGGPHQGSAVVIVLGDHISVYEVL